MVDEESKLKFQASLLVDGTYCGAKAKMVLEKIEEALSTKQIGFEELGITPLQLARIKKEIEKNEKKDVCEMSVGEAKDLAKNFSKLWQQYKSETDIEKKEAILDFMKSLWPQITHALSKHLVSNSDFSQEVADEYFEISALVHGNKSVC